MRTGRYAVAVALALLPVTMAQGQTSLKLPGPIGGGVMTNDGKTLIVSVPANATLIYVDTVAEKELKRVDLEFQPGALAIQGKKLFVAAKGSASIHVLDADTGKETKEVKLKGEPVTYIGCHSTKGLIYAANTADAIFSVDPKTYDVVTTKARGQMVVVDPSEGKFLYTGTQKPSKDVLVIKEGPGKTVQVSMAKANRFALLLKYAVKDDGLELVGANDHGSINGVELAVSPDGKRVAMAGAGGWASATDESKRSYCIPVFDSEDIKTVAGQIDLGPNPLRVAFHPKLNVIAAARSGTSEIVLCDGKSLVKKGDPIALKGGAVPMLLTFGGQGTKLVYLTGVIPSKELTLQFQPLTLTDKDKETLQKAYAN